MSIQDILAKIAKGEELTEDERSTVADFNPTDVASRRVKEVQEKAAKEAAALKAQLDELQAKVDERDTAQLSEAEKLKRDVAKAQKALEQAKADAEAARKEAAQTQRNYALESVMGGIPWVDDAARAAGRILLQQQLSEVEDLSDATAVKPLVDAAKESVLSRLIAAEGVHGTGIHNNATNRAGAAKAKEPEFKYKPGMFDGMTPKEATEFMNKAWKTYDVPQPAQT